MRIGAARLWQALAELEQRLGKDVIAAAYRLRLARLTGQVSDAGLRTIVDTLNGAGFTREALAAQAMFAPGSIHERKERCLELLDSAFRANRVLPDGEYQFVDDRRPRLHYRVSVIVSLYNAAPKLAGFLQELSQQTLCRFEQMEIILIDSGSPTAEREVFLHAAPEIRCPVVYARTADRETIQSAWNRGISLSRSPYLCFLGVDEIIVPDCLQVLAEELDRQPAIDWVQANTVVTAVDSDGTFVDDVMVYERSSYHQDLAYLETAYLSWVGALYRRSIHDRFGYYDPSFRAAGDTEFKNRVLPHIKSKHVARTLGAFRDFPEERTTAHPRAEIEDLRAWYLHRTPAGIHYAYRARDAEAVTEQFFRALRYRKSYRKHWSTDMDYADGLASHLKASDPRSPALPYWPGVKRLLRAYRCLDSTHDLTTAGMLKALGQAFWAAMMVAADHRQRGLPFQPVYRIRNDNRYEQHSWSWSTEAAT
jgi:glycosyltransferase involved in cell wall biosynthesis